MVLTRDEHHPDTPVVARPVVATLGNTAQILRLIVGEREIRTSPEHPFYVKDRGWRPARLIQPGDELLTEAGTWARCAAAVLTADFAPVYNVEIAEHHGLGAQCVFAHERQKPLRTSRESSSPVV